MYAPQLFLTFVKKSNTPIVLPITSILKTSLSSKLYVMVSVIIEALPALNTPKETE